MKKLITVLMVVIIPLLSAFAIGLYGYKRYQQDFVFVSEKGGYFETRLEENNTESQIKAYLDYYASYYQEIASQDVNNAAGKKLFTVKGYAVAKVTYDDDNEESSRTLTYQFFVFNIDYGMLYKEIFTNDAVNSLKAFLPKLSLDVVDHDKIGTDEELSKSVTATYITLDDTSTIEAIMKDYNWVGFTREDGTQTKRTSEGKEIGTFNIGASTLAVAPVNVFTFAPDKEYSSNIDLVFKAIDSEHANDENSTVEVGTVSLTGIAQKAKNFNLDADGVIKAYDQDIFKAGYFKYAVKQYLWWEATIAFVIVLILMIVIVAVWNIDNKQNANKDKKNLKK